MAKTWDYRGNGRKGSFGQKKKKLAETEDLKSRIQTDLKDMAIKE